MSQAQQTIRVLFVQGGAVADFSPFEWLGDEVDVVSVESLDRAQDALADSEFDFVVASPEWLHDLNRADLRADVPTPVTALGQAVGIIDRQGTLVWANPKLLSLPESVRQQVTQTCAESFGWLVEGNAAASSSPLRGHRFSFRTDDHGKFELSVTPMIDLEQHVTQVVAVVHDTRHDQEIRARLDAATRAGLELLHLNPKQFAHLGAQERLALLEQKILRSAREILEFDGFAVCVLDRQTNKLDLVLSIGMPEAARTHDLSASPRGHGISGYVAYQGRSYVCHDVTHDLLYLKGIPGACSSLTVPVKLDDETVGILDFESRKLEAFDDDSRQCAEVFGRYVAVALHVLELLIAERQATMTQIGTDIMSEATGPLNDIITDVSALRDDTDLTEDMHRRLAKIGERAEIIRESIKQSTSPKPGLLGHRRTGLRRRDPVLANRRILVADDEQMIREIIRDVLVSYGAEVRIAQDGEEAIDLIGEQAFDLVLSDIKMPRSNGYQVFAAAKDANAETPVILMTGFGYDPNHSIVRARREGLAAVLFKPFKVDQLLGEVRTALRTSAST